jgi:hypothetical protein
MRTDTIQSENENITPLTWCALNVYFKDRIDGRLKEYMEFKPRISSKINGSWEEEASVLFTCNNIFVVTFSLTAFIWISMSLTRIRSEFLTMGGLGSACLALLFKNTSAFLDFASACCTPRAGQKRVGAACPLIGLGGDGFSYIRCACFRIGGTFPAVH